MKRGCMDNKSFGKQLRYIRKKRKMKVEQLAEILELSDKTIWNIENGNRSTSLENLISICNALNISPEFLLSRDLNKGLEKPMSEYDKLFQLILEFTPGELNQFMDLAELMIKNRERYK